jgi:hypothetical protein
MLVVNNNFLKTDKENKVKETKGEIDNKTNNIAILQQQQFQTQGKRLAEVDNKEVISNIYSNNR